MIHACLSRQPNRYEAVVTLARKAKQRTLLDQVAGQQNTEGIKPLLQQMREETKLWDEDPQRDEPGEAFSWPPKIGVTWTDDGKADLEVLGVADARAGRGRLSVVSCFKFPVPLCCCVAATACWGCGEPLPDAVLGAGSLLRRAPALRAARCHHGTRRQEFLALSFLRAWGVCLVVWGGSRQVDARRCFRSTRFVAGYFGCKRIALALSVVALPHNCGQTPLLHPPRKFQIVKRV